MLLVEDEDAVRELACQALETKGYRVLPARNAAGALAAFEQARDEVAIVVTDVVMPDMGGREVAERLRAIRPDLPVLYVSGYAEPPAEHPLAARGADFLRKPFSPSELSRTVRRMLDRNPGPRPSSV